MVDPVFVDTSEGRALVADSLNTEEKQQSQPSNITLKKNEKVISNEDKCTKNFENKEKNDTTETETKRGIF